MKILVYALLVSSALLGSDSNAQNWQFDGNLKYLLVNTAYPVNSFYRDLTGSKATDNTASARINLAFDFNQWSAKASYQLIGIQGDTLEDAREFSNGVLLQSPMQNDDARLLDLTDMIEDQNDHAALHRLDRLTIGYHSDKNVIKLGRQAVSWGNGLIYTPMDFFNPFDPAAIDTEYKPGEDMLYAQHLFDNGDDLQMIWVARRNEQQQTSQDVNSLALKYHGFWGTNEYDLIVAEHYQDTIIGVGGSASVGGSVVRADWVMTDTDEKRFHNFVANISYSWVAWDKNISGSLEYFHNDFGLRGNAVSFAELSSNEALLNRVSRGELFTLGRDYLAGSLVVEMAPLWLLTPNVFYSLTDNSALAQIVSQHDLTQNTQLVAALSVPLGPKETEFGGISLGDNDPGLDEKFSSSSWSLYAQVGWYF